MFFFEHVREFIDDRPAGARAQTASHVSPQSKRRRDEPEDSAAVRDDDVAVPGDGERIFRTSVGNLRQRLQFVDPTDLLEQAEATRDRTAISFARRAMDLWVDLLVDTAALETKCNSFEELLETVRERLDGAEYVSSSPGAEFSNAGEDSESEARMDRDDDDYVPQHRR